MNKNFRVIKDRSQAGLYIFENYVSGVWMPLFRGTILEIYAFHALGNDGVDLRSIIQD